MIDAQHNYIKTIWTVKWTYIHASLLTQKMRENERKWGCLNRLCGWQTRLESSHGSTFYFPSSSNSAKWIQATWFLALAVSLTTEPAST
ncbi:hypothetical protein Prudu_007602 [Prunus dulcis]|uniref:Uncharacterized protein n=1 Tax=Prunus dulcis TaxID=3755 RepID=A0A4Y1R2A9_PRUDU|nr:hypothetical protein Prudu_007602 [Prunus dulcis]